jgi:DNA polymerase I-like protein with 3'-5' exonuclease and polymerase domains/uracil-DNA glycosylase
MKISGEGPIPARILIVGEFPSERDRVPFDGATGMELNRMLHEVGIMKSDCYVTYACKSRPPLGQITAFVALKKKDIGPSHQIIRGLYCTPQIHEGVRELETEIAMVQPNIIIAMGNLALWALTGHWGVLKWRGSQLLTDKGVKVIPTLTPGAVIREWPQRAVVLSDLRRVKRHMATRVYSNKPEWRFLVRPSFDEAMSTLAQLLIQAETSPSAIWLDFDIETRGGHIDCIGLSWTLEDAICIPLMARGKPLGYWETEQEVQIVYRLYKLLTHKRILVRWQNGLYDAQYVHRHWHFIPRGGQDTMITQHSVFAALPKGLAFIASMYADWYVYWKDEGKIATDVPEEQRWTYNLQDCVYTREAGEVLQITAEAMNLKEVDAHQQKLFYPVLNAMIKGVRIRPEVKAQMALDIQEELSHREAFLHSILGHTINPSSPKQMQALFYDDLKQPVIYKRTVAQGRTSMSPTCDDEALSKIAAKEPLIKPICNCIADIRTLNKFLGDFVMMPLDDDGRMRCSFNIAGDAGGKSAPYSYRLSSSKNPFGSGGNLQTIPSEKSKSSGKAAARGSMDFTLPNIRSMYGPDPGFTFFDMDLDRADLQVVVREAGEPEWIAAMTQGVDMHLLNAFIIAKKEPPPLDELVETHPRYADHRIPLKYEREFAKIFAHATNYGGGAKTVAAHTGRTVHEIDAAQKYWFSAHPGIHRWHQRTFEQIQKYRFVENKWGYRWYIFDRLEALLPEALAWVPQSTVGILINRIWTAFYENIPELQVLLQVHDSLAGQFPTHLTNTIIPLMEKLSKIEIPYEVPLIIPTGVKTSTVSWGDVA